VFFLKITDRKKDILVNAGELINEAKIEKIEVESPAQRAALLLGFKALLRHHSASMTDEQKQACEDTGSSSL
jgi:long-subunit acyl-CoA synthetase (AMP-forming)